MKASKDINKSKNERAGEFNTFVFTLAFDSKMCIDCANNFTKSMTSLLKNCTVVVAIVPCVPNPKRKCDKSESHCYFFVVIAIWQMFANLGTGMVAVTSKELKPYG